MDDLGAESIDLLDILFRIERSTGVKIQASDLGEYIQGGIPDDEFGDENGIVSREGPRAPAQGDAADRPGRVRRQARGGEGDQLLHGPEPRRHGRRACRGGRLSITVQVGVDIVGVERVARLVDARSGRCGRALHPARAGVLPAAAPRVRAPRRRFAGQGGGAQGVRHRLRAAGCAGPTSRSSTGSRGRPPCRAAR